MEDSSVPTSLQLVKKSHFLVHADSKKKISKLNRTFQRVRNCIHKTCYFKQYRIWLFVQYSDPWTENITFYPEKKNHWALIDPRRNFLDCAAICKFPWKIEFSMRPKNLSTIRPCFYWSIFTISTLHMSDIRVQFEWSAHVKILGEFLSRSRTT